MPTLEGCQDPSKLVLMYLKGINNRIQKLADAKSKLPEKPVDQQPENIQLLPASTNCMNLQLCMESCCVY